VQGSRIVLSVQDNGTGFPKDWKPQQLEIFESNRPRGMGIGLWLSHKIVQLHGGQLNFFNLDPCGAKVSVDFANAEQMHIG
jgi:nitrogen fixation/metabolism regulation signal transduction histidine kinase